ncbi:MAG: S41 family peptidase [Bacteroidota bacterium]
MKARKVILGASLILLSFSVGFITNVSDDYYEISKNLDIFGRLYREVNSLYVEETDPEELMRTGIDAMLKSLDPYTSYISEDELDDYRFMSTGQYGGIGALVGKREGKFFVIEAYKDYPADKAGLKAGDEILQIDQQAVDGDNMEVADLRKMLRGDKATHVKLLVNRKGSNNAQTFKILRDRIHVKNVPYFGMVNEEVGYIALSGFTKDASREVQYAIQVLKEATPDLSGLILDLRGNPGGRLDEAVKVANVFVPQKEIIVETRGRLEDSRRVHFAQRIPMDTKIPLAVLVNKRSASASEIVAGAIQDLDRGVIVGQQSFGKGLVQNIRPLSYNTQLKVTTAKYYTPSGRCIQALDYGQKDSKGRAIRVADSARRAFQTSHGRTVYDGGGIAPDIPVELPVNYTIVQELQDQGLIFDFATQFVVSHAQIPSPRSFQVTSEMYNDFLNFVKEREFAFQTKADKELSTLKEVVQKEAYADQLEQELAQLASELDRLKDKDLNKHKDHISWLLKQEIIKRYYYEAGTLESALDHDQEVKEAVNVLRNASDYTRILNKQ